MNLEPAWKSRSTADPARPGQGMITREQAGTLSYGDHVHYDGPSTSYPTGHRCRRIIDADGRERLEVDLECRVSGALQTSRFEEFEPDKFRLPLSAGASIAAVSLRSGTRPKSRL